MKKKTFTFDVSCIVYLSTFYTHAYSCMYVGSGKRSNTHTYTCTQAGRQAVLCAFTVKFNCILLTVTYGIRQDHRYQFLYVFFFFSRIRCCVTFSLASCCCCCCWCSYRWWLVLLLFLSTEEQINKQTNKEPIRISRVVFNKVLSWYSVKVKSYFCCSLCAQLEWERARTIHTIFYVLFDKICIVLLIGLVCWRHLHLNTLRQSFSSNVLHLYHSNML